MRCVIILSLLVCLTACASDPYADRMFDRFKGDSAGLVVVESLKRQGYLDWESEDGMTLNLRTREWEGEEDITLMETVSLDLENDRMHIRGNRGAAFVDRVLTADTYWETWDRLPLRDAARLDEGRSDLFLQYLLTTMPYLLGRYEAMLEGAERVTIEGVLYEVIKVRFPVSDALVSGSEFTLYITHSTRLLQQVDYAPVAGPLKGRTILCRLENFADRDGVFMPLYRKYYLTNESTGERSARPFREQWLFKVDWVGGFEDDLFKAQ